MTTQTLTLSDFLLARIAERRSVAEYTLEQGRSLVRDGEVPHVRGAETSVAEYESMRRLAARQTCAEMLAQPDDDCGDTECMIIREDRRILALPYADHPDYREEWRPVTTCEHDWINRGEGQDEWRECYLCGKQEDR